MGGNEVEEEAKICERGVKKSEESGGEDWAGERVGQGARCMNQGNKDARTDDRNSVRKTVDVQEGVQVRAGYPQQANAARHENRCMMRRKLERSTRSNVYRDGPAPFAWRSLGQ